jgi:4,5-dihydroxyphthalate decarboxylase
MEPLRDGRVQPEGISLNFIPLWVSETFYRMKTHKQFDISEISFGEYLHTLSTNKERDFIAIPVFPSRMFRHRSIFVNSDSGIEKPGDIIGKKVGILRYAQTASIWIRGILSEFYGVPIDSVEYYVGPLEKSRSEDTEGGSLFGAPEKIFNSKIKIRKIKENESLSNMLEKGEIDVLYSSRVPSTFGKPGSKIKRLFSNFQEEEMAFFKKTKIFPIMHTVVFRNDIYEKNRWAAESMFKAFNASKIQAQKDLEVNGVLKTMYPWILEDIQKWKEIIGNDYWPYGANANKETLDAYLRYCFEQGITQRHLTLEDIFAKESLEPFKKEIFMP